MSFSFIILFNWPVRTHCCCVGIIPKPVAPWERLGYSQKNPGIFVFQVAFLSAAHQRNLTTEAWPNELLIIMCVPLHRQEPGRGRCSRVLRQPSPISFFTIPSMLPSASDTRRLLHFQKHLHHPGRKKEVTKETELAKPQTHAHTCKHAHHMHTRTHITQTCTHMHTSHTHTPHTDTHTSHTHAHVTHVHILVKRKESRGLNQSWDWNDSLMTGSDSLDKGKRETRKMIKQKQRQNTYTYTYTTVFQ